MNLAKSIKTRWSPRGFSNKPVTNEMIDLLFEAARWAPSARNEQPWLYFYAKKEDGQGFSELFNCLDEGNQIWADSASVLMVSVMKKHYDYKNRPNKNALHDLGAANASLAIQASEMGLQAHQMGGFDKQKITALLQLNNERFEPVTVIAIGFPGNPEQLPENLRIRESEPRTRKKLNEFVINL